MRHLNLLTLIAIFSLACMGCSDAKKKNVVDETTDDGKNPADDVTIEENPDYEDNGGVSSDADDDDHDDDNSSYGESESDFEDEDNDLEDAATVKQKIDGVLLKSKRKYKVLKRYTRKNRAKITVCLALFAFRHEIGKAIVHIFKNEMMNSNTGKLRISPTSALKLLLFVDLMKKLQSGSNASQPGFQALVNLGQANPVMGVFFNRVMRVPLYNPAFIPAISQHYTFERINERYVKDGMALHKAIHAQHTGFRWPVAETAITHSMMAGERVPNNSISNDTMVIVEMTGLDTGLSTMEQIRDQVSFLVSQYRSAAMRDPCDANATQPVEATNPPLEIVIVLESPGGSAADYGLASQQLLRLRNEPGITLTVCVDKVAASGGYMMACTASPGQLFAAPFAIVGSIGVIGQIVNAQKLLEGWGLSPMVFRGGKDKVPLGIIGDVTESAKAKTQAMIDMTHKAFQDLVVSARPILRKSMKKVGSGDIYMGSDALDLGLIDRITTSDEYISSKVYEGTRVLKLVKNRKARFPFGPNFDNYDTSLKSSFLASISDLVVATFQNTVKILRFPTNWRPEAALRTTPTLSSTTDTIC